MLGPKRFLLCVFVFNRYSGKTGFITEQSSDQLNAVELFGKKKKNTQNI